MSITIVSEEDEGFESKPLDWIEYVGQIQRPSREDGTQVWINICESDDLSIVEDAIKNYKCEGNPRVRVVEINNHVVLESNLQGYFTTIEANRANMRSV